MWLARGLKDDDALVSLELEPSFAAVARKNLERAGESSKVEIRVGKALDSLSELIANHEPPFDFIFLDADKPNYPNYFPLLLKLSRRGTIIIADNVVREGAVIDEASEDEMVQGARSFNQLISEQSGIEATAIQTVGSKGHDGFALITVTQNPDT